MADNIPPWLQAMRTITGTTEYSGSADNPKIMFMADYVGHRWPDQAAYASYYTGDDVAWCGLTVAFCMSVADICPVYGPTDTDRWMWAQAWQESQYWAAQECEPCLGAVIVMQREGGGHVCLMEQHDDGSFLKDGYYRGRGGNQSDAVTVANQAKSSVIALMWPTGHRRPGRIPPPDVANQTMWLQSGLNILMPKQQKLVVDGEVGPKTIEAVEDYQKREGLNPTGEADKKTVDAMLSDLIEWNEHRRA